MQLGKFRGFARLALGLSLLTVAAGSAQAIPLVFNGGTGSQQFTMSLVPSGTLSVSANLSYRLSTADFPIPGLQGTVLNGGINIPNQSVNIALQGGVANFNTVPTGSATLTLAGQQSALATDPGGDGLPPFGPGTGTVNGLPSVLTHADVTNLVTTLIQNQAFSLNPVGVNGTTTLDVLGLFDLNFDTEINAVASGSLSNVNFTQNTPGNDLLPGSGAEINPGTPDKSANYLFAGAPGDFSATVNANVGLNAELSLSVFGLFDIPFGFNLGNANVLNNQVINAPFAIVGAVNMADLNPGGYAGLPTGDDMRFTFTDNGYLNLLPLSFDLSTAGNLPVNIDSDFAVDLGIGTIDFDIDLDGTVVYNFNGNLSASNVTYRLQDTIEDVVIPEPSSLCLAGLGLVAAIPLLRRRLRK